MNYEGYGKYGSHTFSTIPFSGGLPMGIGNTPMPKVKEPKGFKADAGKADWSLLPIEAVEEIIKVLEFGKDKYTVDGWKDVPNAENRYYSALMRHVAEYRKGEKFDSETGLPHIAHAATNALFLIWFGLKGVK